MFIVTITYHRPSADIPWWQAQPKYFDDATANALASGDLIMQQVEQINPLTASYIAIWKDRAAYEKWVTENPIIGAISRLRDAYNVNNGITWDREETET